MKRTLMGLVASTALLAGSSAFALTISGTTGADTIVIGYVSADDDIVACVGSTLTTITTNSSTLDVDVVVNADQGADTIKVLGSGDSNESVCSKTLTGSFSDGGNFIDVNGEEDNDTIRGGRLDGFLHGDAGNDKLRVRDAFGGSSNPSRAFGEDGDDNLCATTVSSGNMALDGGDGADRFEHDNATSGTYFYNLGLNDLDVDTYDTDGNDSPQQREDGIDVGTSTPNSTCMSI
jgi:hypothetical protein